MPGLEAGDAGIELENGELLALGDSRLELGITGLLEAADAGIGLDGVELLKVGDPKLLDTEGAGLELGGIELLLVIEFELPGLADSELLGTENSELPEAEESEAEGVRNPPVSLETREKVSLDEGDPALLVIEPVADPVSEMLVSERVLMSTLDVEDSSEGQGPGAAEICRPVQILES